nr:MAG TPA: hypothetical protein [Caudoviricetes sp.]
MIILSWSTNIPAIPGFPTRLLPSLSKAHRIVSRRPISETPCAMDLVPPAGRAPVCTVFSYTTLS